MNKGLNFKSVGVEDSELILNWRTSQRVTQFMATDVDYNLNAQVDWINNIKNRSDYLAWVIQLNGVSIGLIYLSDICWKKKTASWGYYIGNDDYLGYGGFIPPYFYNFVFNTLNFNELSAVVFYNNLSVIKMHIKFGYQFDSSRDEIIYKNNSQIKVRGMKLNKSNWDKEKYNKFTSNFQL